MFVIILFRDNTVISSGSMKLSQHQVEYRSFQVVNILAQTLSVKLVAGGLWFGSAMVITAIYCLIRCHKSMDPVFAFFLALLVVIVLETIIVLVTKAIDIRINSEKVLLSFQNGTNPNLDKLDFLFWKSCRPLKMKVGSVGWIETHDFLVITLETIVKSTINLLLNF